MPLSANIGFVCGYILDGKGGARRVELEDAINSKEQVWLHFGSIDIETKLFLVEDLGIKREIVRQLMVDDTRPFVREVDGAILAFVRGVNLNPDAKPEDMIMLRVFMHENMIITVRRRTLVAVQKVVDLLEEGKGPQDVSMLLGKMIEKLIDHMWPVHDEIEKELSTYEDNVFSSRGAAKASLHENISEIRLLILQLYRYMRPMRDALRSLSEVADADPRLSADFEHSVNESSNRLTQVIEDLENFRERADILHEELISQQERHTGRATYLLTIVATVFLPPSLITGIFGMNTGHIPFIEGEHGFYIAEAILLLSVLIPLIVLKQMGLLSGPGSEKKQS